MEQTNGAGAGISSAQPEVLPFPPRWQYEPLDDNPAIGKGGDTGLLKAIDALVDAILTP